MIDTNSPEVIAFVKAANDAYTSYWNAMGYTHAQVPKVVATDKQKFIALHVHEERNGVYSPYSIYCFIAKEAGNTRTLGEIKEGDVFKAAGMNAPAKNARGNVFSPTNGAEAISQRGTCIRYL